MSYNGIDADSIARLFLRQNADKNEGYVVKEASLSEKKGIFVLRNRKRLRKTGKFISWNNLSKSFIVVAYREASEWKKQIEGLAKLKINHEYVSYNGVANVSIRNVNTASRLTYKLGEGGERKSEVAKGRRIELSRRYSSIVNSSQLNWLKILNRRIESSVLLSGFGATRGRKSIC